MTEHRTGPPDHLYTWVDLDEYFSALAVSGRWPDWLIEVNAFWDGVELTVRSQAGADVVWNWLEETLGPLTVDPEHGLVLLEAAGGESGGTSDAECLPVEIRPCDEPPAIVLPPRWVQRRVVRQLGETLAPPEPGGFPEGVEVCAFHSFKGGTGRTLHCTALARALSTGRGHDKVLLVDADFEAPGITWMLAAGGQRIDFSLKDFLALLHGSPDGRGDTAISFGQRYLANQERDGVFVMPAVRDLGAAGPLRIEPKDLATTGRSRYYLTEALAHLAHLLGARTVLVDLRAGSSELSAPVLLDPRVHRVFVTTVSEQSVRGTAQLIRAVGRLAPSRSDEDPACSVLLTQFQEKDHAAWLTEVSEELLAALATTAPAVSDLSDGVSEASVESIPADQDAESRIFMSPFDPRLLALPASWADVVRVIRSTEVMSSIAPLAETLAPVPGRTTGLPAQDVSVSRGKLRDVASGMVFAEGAEDDEGLLVTEALANLLTAHRTETPVEVLVGAKGSGKTFTYLRLCRAGTWARFAEDAGVGDVTVDQPVVPVLASQHLTESLRNALDGIRLDSVRRLGGGEPSPFLSIRETVSAALHRDLDDAAWRRVWLNCLAWATGLRAEADDAEMVLTGFARHGHALFVLDGLEDLFPNFTDDPRQQQALRVLLTNVPEWLRSLRGRPLGLIVFVRRDLVVSSVKQNVDQFLSRHGPYELRWNHDAALRLVAWVAARAGILHPPDPGPGRGADPPVPVRELVPLWGTKLGTDRSREARSHVWFLAALSDFALQIQARDVVSFLAGAATEALNDQRMASHWPDRVLPPAAMRKALPVCSTNKIKAIEQENPPISAVFDRLRRLPAEARKVPFAVSDVDLGAVEIRLLESNGVLLREDDRCWIPEIYRYGLGFGLRGKGRPRVLTVARLTGSAS